MFLPFLFTLQAVAVSPPRVADSADTWLRRAAEVMGGVDALRGLGSIRLEGVQVASLIGVSADRAHPLVLVNRFSELKDFNARVGVRHFEMTLPMRPAPIAGNQPISAVTAPGQDQEQWFFAPERIVLTAWDGPHRGLPRDTTFSERPAHIVEFGPDRSQLYLDRVTNLPLGWTSMRAYPDDINTWGPWGDVRSSAYWTRWTRTPDGFRYPLMQTVTRNGFVASQIALRSVTPNATVAPDSFPPQTPRATAPLVLGSTSGTEPREISPGILLIPGPYNVVAIRQPDGVLVLEAPHSSAYSRLVLAEISRRFPGAPVKAVVVTTDAWPHDAGVREYVARGIPLYVTPSAAKLVRALLASSHRLVPDSLQRAPRVATIRLLDSTLRIGTGANQVQLIRPLQAGGEHGASAILAYFSASRLLYAGDLLIPQRFEPNFWGQAWTELVSVVGAHGLAVDSVVGLHDLPMAWTSLTTQLAPPVPH